MELRTEIKEGGYQLGFKSTTYEKYDSSNIEDNNKPWSGIYIAQDLEMAKGYVVDYVDGNGNGQVHIQCVSYKPSNQNSQLTVIICDDLRMGDGELNEKEKIDLLRPGLGKIGLILPEDNYNLMEFLGKQETTMAFKCICNKKDKKYELIIPINKKEEITMEKIETITVKGYNI